MAEQQEQVLIEVKWDTKVLDNARVKLAEATRQVTTLKQEQKLLQKAFDEGRISDENYAKAISQNKAELESATRAIKSNTAVLQASEQATYDASASLDEQRQVLNTLQKAYASMDAEQKEAMGGQEALEAAIKSVSDSLKAQEHAIGEDQRNVGNYTESIEKAFGDIGKAAGDLSPAVGVLRSMGGEGKKLGDALDMVSKIMQIVAKSGNAVANAQKAQTAATNAQTAATGGATVAQEGLNAAMNANPIGLIIAGISTLLPLIQSFISATDNAEASQAKFNQALEDMEFDMDMETRRINRHLKLMQLEGKTALEVATEREKLTKEVYENAKREYEELGRQRLSMSEDELESSKELFEAKKTAMDNALSKMLDAQDEWAFEYRKQQLEQQKQAKADAKDAQEERIEADKQLGIQHMEAVLGIAQMEADALAQQALELQQQSQELLASLNGDEEEEEVIPTVDEMARDMFGLDAEGVEYFKSLLDEGVSVMEAKTKAIANQTTRMAKSWATSFGNLGNAFNEMGDMLGEFEEDSADAARAQKGFAFAGIMLNQAQSIANGALAISEGVASAASIPFPANIPAIITIVAQIAALMAGVGSSIAQAKKIFSQADAGKFADGGIVGGTSYSGDRLTAHVNSGEMILPVSAQKNLFDALSSGEGANRTLGIDYEAMASAVSAQPAPVVVYSEMQEFGQKVTTYNEIASI